MAAEGADADGLLPSVLPGEIPAYATIDDRFSQAEFPAGRAGHPGIAAPEAVRQRHRGTLLRMLERFAALWGFGRASADPAGAAAVPGPVSDACCRPNPTLNLRHPHALRLAAGIAGRVSRTADWADEAGALTAAPLGRRFAVGRPTPPENWSIDFPDGSACHGLSAQPLVWR